MKKLFLIIPLFLLLFGCTTTQYISQDVPQDDVYINTEYVTTPTMMPYTNIYLDVNPFHWYWGSYYSYPTYYDSYYYYPSCWNPYWYHWHPIEPYYFGYGYYGYTYYNNHHHDWNDHDHYYGHRNGYSPDLPPPKSVTPSREKERIAPVLTKPVYSKPAKSVVTQPEIRYGEPRKTTVKTYTPPTYNQTRSPKEYVSPSSKSYVQPNTRSAPSNSSPSKSAPTRGNK